MYPEDVVACAFLAGICIGAGLVIAVEWFLEHGGGGGGASGGESIKSRIPRGIRRG